MNLSVLESAGIDTQEALGRVMGNEGLYERLLGRFLADESCADIAVAVDAHDVDAAIGATHALKGVAGNLSIRPVYELAAKQCDLFRAGAWDEAVALSNELEMTISRARAAIEEAVG